MAQNTESFHGELYDLLKVRGHKPVPLNSKNKRVNASQEADVIEFTFTKEGKEFGKAWISAEDGKNIKVYYDEEQQDSPSDRTKGVDYDDTWTGLLKHLKNWSQRRQLGFELANKDRLGDDMKQRDYYKMKEKLGESYHAMGKKASYNDAVPNVKVILQHSRNLEEGEARFRNVARIFLENVDGERFLAPTTKPGLARVYARHIAEGGLPNDERWNHIKSLCEDFAKMAGFVRATRNKEFNESALQLVNEGINHYNNIKESLHKMTTHRGYHNYFESYTPTLMEDELDENIANLFVQENIDPRIESAMPILARLKKPVNEMEEVDSLAEWADDVINEKLELEDSIEENFIGMAPQAVAEKELEEARTKKVNLEVTDKGAVYINGTRITGRGTKWGVQNTVFQAKVPLDQVVQTLRDNGFGNIKLDPQYSMEMGIQLEEDLGPEQKKKIDEISPELAIDAYRNRKSRADDFYSEPDDERKAEKTLSRIDKKYGPASKIATGARRGAEIDQKGRGHQGGVVDYLDAKQDVYKSFDKPTTKKGTKQRLGYMKLNKGRLTGVNETMNYDDFDDYKLNSLMPSYSDNIRNFDQRRSDVKKIHKRDKNGYNVVTFSGEFQGEPYEITIHQRDDYDKIDQIVQEKGWGREGKDLLFSFYDYVQSLAEHDDLGNMTYGTDELSENLNHILKLAGIKK